MSHRKCESCGVAMVEHPGIYATCAEAMEARAEVAALKERVRELEADNDRLRKQSGEYFLDLGASQRRCGELEEEAARLRAIVDKLPRTADGVVVTPGMKVWRYSDGSLAAWMSDLMAYRWEAEINPASAYSTPEAAEAARKGG